mmetsp:Transcript_46881/g.149694  ORF Transcript_46881/g.149694 Transcript_46881/m.149694 type:complete len:221 (-) Transcript_46881:98-760(-)
MLAMTCSRAASRWSVRASCSRNRAHWRRTSSTPSVPACPTPGGPARWHAGPADDPSAAAGASVPELATAAGMVERPELPVARCGCPFGEDRGSRLLPEIGLSSTRGSALQASGCASRALVTGLALCEHSCALLAACAADVARGTGSTLPVGLRSRKGLPQLLSTGRRTSPRASSTPTPSEMLVQLDSWEGDLLQPHAAATLSRWGLFAEAEKTSPDVCDI